MRYELVLTRHTKGKDLLISLYINNLFICSFYSMDSIKMRLKDLWQRHLLLFKN